MGLYEDILELSTENADRENGLRKISELCKWRSIPEDGLQCITSPKEAIVNFTKINTQWNSLSLQEKKDIIFVIRTISSSYIKAILHALLISNVLD